MCSVVIQIKIFDALYQDKLGLIHDKNLAKKNDLTNWNGPIIKNMTILFRLKVSINISPFSCLQKYL